MTVSEPEWKFGAGVLKQFLDPKIKKQLGGKYIRWGDYHWRQYYSPKINGYMKHVDYVIEFFQGKSGRLLDIGCGEGLIMKRIQEESNLECYGIDSSPLAIALAHRHEVWNCETISIEDYSNGKFNYIFMGDVLEHLKNPEATLRKIKELLYPDGTIFISLPVFTEADGQKDYFVFDSKTSRELVEKIFQIELFHISNKGKKGGRIYIVARTGEYAKNE